MTVVAWDQQIIAVESQANISGSVYAIQKWEEYQYFDHKHILLITGHMAYGLSQIDWYKGQRRKEFPKAPENEFGRLVVATPQGVHWYEGNAHQMTAGQNYMALGSGMDFALGAFHRGATVIQAVEASCAHDEACGGPIIAWNYRTGERIQ